MKTLKTKYFFLSLCLFSFIGFASCSKAESPSEKPETKNPPPPAGTQTVAENKTGNQSVDSGLLDEWSTLFRNQTGIWLLKFKPEAGGRYRTKCVSMLPIPDETGLFEAGNGKWSLKKDNGETDSGTYTFTSDNTVTFQGQKGALTWFRGELSPQSMNWPPSGLPDFVKKYAEVAKLWQPDAALVSMNITLQQGQPYYIGSPQGAFMIQMRFCSRAGQSALLITPRGPGGEFYEMPGVPCNEEPMALDFMDLPQAIEQAREKGMKSTVIERADLENARKGTSIGGADISGLNWRIQGSSYIDDQSFIIQAVKVEQSTIRTIDPWALITADEAAQALGVPVVRGNPTSQGMNTWSCLYHSTQSKQIQVQLLIDESPHRDKKGVMDNMKRQGHTPIPGLGDEAYYFDSPIGFFQLDVLVGDTLLQFGMNGTEDELTKAKTLVGKAIQRMISGEGAGEKPSAQLQVVGNWFFNEGGETNVLSIKENGAWSITNAMLLTGAMMTEGNRWSLITRVRKPILEGTFILNGNDSFSLAGAYTDQLSRISVGNIPIEYASLLAPDMMKSGVDPATAANWPSVSVSPNLVGLWKGRYQENNFSEAVWRINPSGPSFVQEFTSVRGSIQPHSYDPDRIIFVSPQKDIDFMDSAKLIDPDHLEVQARDLSTQVWTRKK
jgi:hypothetical protein